MSLTQLIALPLGALGAMTLASPCSADIIRVSGSAVIADPPPDISMGKWTNDLEVRCWFERWTVIAEETTLDHVEPGPVTLKNQLKPGAVAAGTPVESYMLRMDPISGSGVNTKGFCVFDRKIIGVLVLGVPLNSSDEALKRPGITYNQNGDRGLELNQNDSFSISSDRLRIDFDFTTVQKTDDIRVVTEADVCYADCDFSGVLNIEDFICFQTLYALSDPAADCDASGGLDIDDFICFQTVYALGC